MSDDKKYSLPEYLASRLDDIASDTHTTAEELLAGIVDRYVTRHDAVFSSEDERRAFKRIDICIPAVMYVKTEDGTEYRYQPVSIRDVSPTGVRLICPGKKVCGRYVGEHASELKFELIFSFSNEMIPVRFQCEAKRVEQSGSDIHIGALILQSESAGQQVYQKIIDSGLC